LNGRPKVPADYSKKTESANYENQAKDGKKQLYTDAEVTISCGILLFKLYGHAYHLIS
jgi:hypothetical protein